MKQYVYIVVVLLLLQLKAKCMNGDTASFLALPEPILKDEIVRKLVVPARNRFTDFHQARTHFKNLYLTCKKIKSICDMITINVPVEKTEKTIPKTVKEYLKFTQELADKKNFLRESLLPAGKEQELYGQYPERGHLYVPNPNDNDRYPKLSLYLFNYRKHLSERKKERSSKSEQEFWQEFFRCNYEYVEFGQSNEIIKKEIEITDGYVVARKKDLIRLLENLHDVNKRDTEGRSPLYYAIINPECSANKVQLLIDYGAAVDDIDGNGKNALQIAQSIRFDGGEYENIKNEKIQLLSKLPSLKGKNGQSPSEVSLILQLPDDILKTHILKQLLIPKTLRYTDFLEAKTNFRNLVLTCITITHQCRSIPVAEVDENGKPKFITRYLKELCKKANKANELVSSLIPSEITSQVNEDEKNYVVDDTPKADYLYPKLSLYLYNYNPYRFQYIQEIDSEGLKHRGYQYCYITEDQVLDLLKNLHDANRRDTAGRTPLYYAIKNPFCPASVVQLLIDHGATIVNVDSLENNALEIAQSVDPKSARHPIIEQDVVKIHQDKIKLLKSYYYIKSDKSKPKSNSKVGSCSLQ